MQNLAERVRRQKDRPFTRGPVVYWMSREQRVDDNWALIYAAETAHTYHVPLCVAFCMTPEYLHATLRQYSFMVGGLREVEARLRGLGIGFYLLEGYPEIVLPSLLHELGAGLLVADFNPLRPNRRWVARVAGELDIAMHVVDGHNIVPCWSVASRRISTYATFRAKISPLLARFLTDIPAMRTMEPGWTAKETVADWDGALSRVKADKAVAPVSWIEPGESKAKVALVRFLEERLIAYREKSLNPVLRGQSELSPYLHFGNISAQRVAYETQRAPAPQDEKESFLDQLIVRRELADNFCLHTPEYDTTGAFPIWARRSLDEHRSDPREHLYELDDFEFAKTHDPLWNAAQTELVKIGKIHGSLRAYWAVKILEWSRTPEDALSAALYLNDRYSLDGNDPSGYTGISMVIGGLYGRPWHQKEVIGKLKRLTYTQERLSYDVNEYYERVRLL